MGFERESFDRLMKAVWGKKSQMQQAMSRDSKGEPFIIRELEFRGAQTPSQLAAALKVTSGRISTLLAALEKKGLIEREVDPQRPPHCACESHRAGAGEGQAAA